jgi:hypothetical protein
MLYRAVWYMFTNVLQERTASSLRAEPEVEDRRFLRHVVNLLLPDYTDNTPQNRHLRSHRRENLKSRVNEAN